jgi:nucleotide-binding universal stress UspA family protein
MKRIVVGTDGSAAALAAVEVALQEAAIRGAALEVLCVWDLPALGDVNVRYDPIQLSRQLAGGCQQVAVKQLAEAQRRHPAASAIPASAGVKGGSVAQMLVEASIGAELLVVGRTGAGAWQRSLLGSISSACADRSPVPLLVVPHVDPEHEVRRSKVVVVGLDAWHPDYNAVAVAAQEAVLRGTGLRLVVCWEASAAAMMSPDAAAGVRSAEPTYATEVAELARKHLDEFNLDLVDIEIAEGDAGTLLAAWTEAADLVVIGNRRRPLWRRVFEHSTGHYLEGHARGQLLVVPTADEG